MNVGVEFHAIVGLTTVGLIRSKYFSSKVGVGSTRVRILSELIMNISSLVTLSNQGSNTLSSLIIKGLSNLQSGSPGTAAGASFLVTLVSGTAALIAKTAATVANTAVKGAAIIASYALAAGKLVLAAATFFAGADAGAASTLGFGAPVLTALAIAGVVG